MDAETGDAGRRRSPRLHAVIRLGDIGDRLAAEPGHLLSDDELHRLEQQALLSLRIREHEHALDVALAQDATELELHTLRAEHEYERKGRNDAYELTERVRRDDEERRTRAALLRVDLATRWLAVAQRALLLTLGIAALYWCLISEQATAELLPRMFQ